VISHGGNSSIFLNTFMNVLFVSQLREKQLYLLIDKKNPLLITSHTHCLQAEQPIKRSPRGIMSSFHLLPWTRTCYLLWNYLTICTYNYRPYVLYSHLGNNRNMTNSHGYPKDAMKFQIAKRIIQSVSPRTSSSAR
jgi:hypothetical protein